MEGEMNGHRLRGILGLAALVIWGLLVGCADGPTPEPTAVSMLPAYTATPAVSRTATTTATSTLQPTATAMPLATATSALVVTETDEAGEPVTSTPRPTRTPTG